MFIKIRYQLLQLNSVQSAILTIWALIMVSLAISDWSTGWSAAIGAITVGVSVTAGLVIVILWEVWGAAATLRAAGLILGLSLAVEVIGSRTGIPFGMYSYSDMLQPQIFNVPVQIPVGWLMMLPPSWGVAQVISDWIKPCWKFPTFVGLSALAMTAWDLFLDPMMITWKIWVWDNPGNYFGIPGINYLGWLVVSALVTILVRPSKLPIAPLLIIYTAIWLLKSFGLGFFWGILGPAIVGCIVMGSITFFAWHSFILEN